MTTSKYLATVDTDEETGEVTIHVLNEACTLELQAGAAFVENLLSNEAKAAPSGHRLS